MQFHILADTVLPLTGTSLLGERFSPVYPRSSVFRPVCPSAEHFHLACKTDVLNIVLTAPAQLSGSYAMARETLAKEVNCAVLDSRTFAAGQLLLAERAAALASADRFSARVLRDVRRASRRLCCYFVAPNGSAMRLAGKKNPYIRLPFRYTVFRIGEEGEVHRHTVAYAPSPQQVLYRCVRSALKKGKRIAVADDRAPQAAEALALLLARDQASVLRGECIPTDLPFGHGGFLSVAFFEEEA